MGLILDVLALPETDLCPEVNILQTSTSDPGPWATLVLDDHKSNAWCSLRKPRRLEMQCFSHLEPFSTWQAELGPFSQHRLPPSTWHWWAFCSFMLKSNWENLNFYIKRQPDHFETRWEGCQPWWVLLVRMEAVWSVIPLSCSLTLMEESGDRWKRIHLVSQAFVAWPWFWCSS